MGKRKKNILIILQARTSSLRLPGKVLMPLGGYPMAVLCAKRLSNNGHKLVVAIPKNKSDNFLHELLKKNNLKVSRGSHQNVFSRYMNVIKKMKDEDIIIRATADNPFPDGNFVKKIIKFFIKKKLEYLNTHKNFNLPYGLAIQVFYARYLKSIPKKKISKSHYFHVVGPYNQKKNFYKNNEINYKIKRWNKYKKLSIDTLQDYIEIEKIFRKIKSPIKTSWNRLC